VIIIYPFPFFLSFLYNIVISVLLFVAYLALAYTVVIGLTVNGSQNQF